MSEESGKTGPATMERAELEQIAVSIREELRAAAMEDGVKSLGWLAPTAPERVRAWTALSAGLAAGQSGIKDCSGDARALSRELRREYEHLQAWQHAMVLKTSLYQVLVMTVLTIGMVSFLPFLMVAAKGPDAANSFYPPLFNRLVVLLNDAGLGISTLNLVTAAYWGAIGACAASLWGLAYHTTRRTLSLHFQPHHYLKPVMGLFLGALVALMIPASLIAIPTPDQPLPAVTPSAPGTGSLAVWAFAALAGFKERTFNRKIKEIFEAALGTSRTEEQSSNGKPAG